MRTYRSKILACLVSGAWIFMANLSTAIDSNVNGFVQEVKNKTSLTTANDLTLVFNNAPTNVKITDPQGGNPKAGNLAGNTVKWNMGDLPSNVGPGQSGQVTFEGINGTMINKAASFWTVNDSPIIDGLASLGQPPNILLNGGAVAQISNPETFPLVYTNILLYRDNNLANFDTSLFTVPTGQLITGLPSSITLNPGESAMLPFGPIRQDAYQLVLANGSAVSNPSDTFFVATGATIPEPSTGTLLGGACLILLAISGFLNRGIALKQFR